MMLSFFFFTARNLNKAIAVSFCLSFIFPFSGKAQDYVSFKPGEVWKDNKGKPINAHGGGFLFADDTYYWFGEHKVEGKAGNRAMVGVHCYSSVDLYHWKDEGIALTVDEENSDSPIAKGCILERPKVIFNKTTGKYVMWFHLELKGQGYAAAQTGVAISDKVTGPYQFIRAGRVAAGYWPLNMSEQQKIPLKNEQSLQSWTPEWKEAIKDGLYVRREFKKGQMARDMTLFVDDDGKAYHIYASEDNLTLQIAELTEDYTAFTGNYVRVFPAGHREAPALFKKDGKYYLITSDCTGWKPNAASYAVSESVMGPWKQIGNPCVGKDAELTFNSQSTFVIPVQHQPGAFIFVADRWQPDNAIDGRYLFLPIGFDEEEKMSIHWLKEWDLSWFDRRLLK